MQYTKALPLLALLTALPSPAAETSLGAHITVDREFTIYESIVGGELFARVFLSPAVALEASAGYRHTVDHYHGGSYTQTTTTGQVPVLLGVLYAFSPSSELRPWLGAGLVAAPEFSTTTTDPGGFRDDSSHVSFGFHVGAGVQANIGAHWILDGGVRYVPPMGATDSGPHLAYSFLRFQGGLAYRF